MPNIVMLRQQTKMYVQTTSTHTHTHRLTLEINRAAIYEQRDMQTSDQ